MKCQTKFSPRAYKKDQPRKARIIQKSVKRGVVEYEETFRRLARS